MRKAMQKKCVRQSSSRGLTLIWIPAFILTFILNTDGMGVVRQVHAQQPPHSGGEGGSAPRSRWEQVADQVNANTVTMVSGSPGVTYMSFGYDLESVLNDGTNLRILNIVGVGGGQNVRDVRFLRGVDLGLAQTHVLNDYRRTGEIGKFDEEIVYIAKLYNEEVHFITRSDVASLEQLRGKKVNFNHKPTGTRLSARDVFDRLGIKVEEINVGQKDGLEKLKNGEIAATVQSAGKPSPWIAELKASDGYRILPVPFVKEFREDYLPTTLTHKDYPGLISENQTIDTLAVSNLLICYNWPKNTERYRRIEKFTNAFFTKFPEFQKPPRHEKWKETSIYANVSGWKRFGAAEEWLKKNRETTLSQRQGQFEEFLAARKISVPATKKWPESELNRLFEQFLIWSAPQPTR